MTILLCLSNATILSFVFVSDGQMSLWFRNYLSVYQFSLQGQQIKLLSERCRVTYKVVFSFGAFVYELREQGNLPIIF